METTLLTVLSLIWISVGILIAYYFAKVRINQTVRKLKTQLDNEKNLHGQIEQILDGTKNELNNLTRELQEEKSQRLKFETQSRELCEQIRTLKQAETEFKEALNTISQLDEDIKNYKSGISSLQNEILKLKTANAELSAKYQESLRAIENQKKFVNDANIALKDAFNSLSTEALKRNSQSFLDLAKTTLAKHIDETKTDLEKRQQVIDSLIKPLNESLRKIDTKIQDIEMAGQGAYSEIKDFLENMKGTTEKLQKETITLASALKTSYVRGKYGEIGLRRIVEFAGMSEFCDFNEQVSVAEEDGRLRQDLIVKLPGQKRLIIDAKVPFLYYMQAFETTDENQKRDFLGKHSLTVREHLKKLSAKEYWSQFDEPPDYVVMYFQIESAFGAALETDRTLIEDGVNNRIIFATPTTLIALLRTVAFSWQQAKVTENIYQIRDAGIELYNRVTNLIENIAAIGESLNNAAINYNKAVGSLESRFIPQAKKLKEIGGTLFGKDIPEIKQADTALRQLDEVVVPKT